VFLSVLGFPFFVESISEFGIISVCIFFVGLPFFLGSVEAVAVLDDCSDFFTYLRFFLGRSFSTVLLLQLIIVCGSIGSGLLCLGRTSFVFGLPIFFLLFFFFVTGVVIGVVAGVTVVVII